MIFLKIIKENACSYDPWYYLSSDDERTITGWRSLRAGRECRWGELKGRERESPRCRWRKMRFGGRGTKKSFNWCRKLHFDEPFTSSASTILPSLYVIKKFTLLFQYNRYFSLHSSYSRWHKHNYLANSCRAVIYVTHFVMTTINVPLLLWYICWRVPCD